MFAGGIRSLAGLLRIRLLLLLLLPMFLLAPMNATATEADAWTAVFLDVEINGRPMESPRPVLRLGAYVLFPRADLQAWRVIAPAAPAERVGGVDYFDLSGVAGMRLAVDEAMQTVRLDLPPAAFEAAAVQSRGAARAVVSPSATGAFLNYDLALQGGSSGNSYGSAYLDAAASGDWGLAATTMLAGRSPYGGGSSATRLESYWRWDDPERLTRLTIGDGVTHSAAWSLPFRFGGVQFGTAFGLQPGYIAYPTPSLQGGAALPSSVEVYVNDLLRYQGRTEAGPFSVPDVPVLTGAGEMRIAVTDTQGVQRSVSTPYYVSTQLLHAGLSAYSVEGGWTRLAYGERSFDYGRPFGAGTWRHGLDAGVTVELHGEAGARSQTGGAGIAWVWAPWGEFALDAAGSRSDGGIGVTSGSATGHLQRAAFTRVSDDWSLSASRQTASSSFTQVAWQDGEVHVSAQTQVFVGRSVGRFGSLGSSFTQLRYSNGERIEVVSANWTIAVGGAASLSAYIARTRQDGAAALSNVGSAGAARTSVGFMWTQALGERQTASASTQRIDGRASVAAQVDRTPPSDIDGGFGFRVLAGSGDDAHAEADLGWLGRYGSAALEAARLGGESAVRLRASGAVGTAGGLAFATRQSDEAFVLVTVPDAPGLGIYRENQRLATTDDQGRAIVPGLHAYEPNRISIDSEDLPIEALVDKDALQVVPRYKGVALARFGVARTHAMRFTVRLPDGRFLPPGVEVRGAGRPEPSLAGYDGALDIDAPKPGERFEAHWPGGDCAFVLGPVKSWHGIGAGAASAEQVCRPLFGAEAAR